MFYKVIQWTMFGLLSPPKLEDNMSNLWYGKLALKDHGNVMC